MHKDEIDGILNCRSVSSAKMPAKGIASSIRKGSKVRIAHMCCTSASVKIVIDSQHIQSVGRVEDVISGLNTK